LRVHAITIWSIGNSVLPANAFSHDHLSMGECDDGIHGRPIAAIYCAFNETRVTPVSLIEQFLYQQRFRRAHETDRAAIRQMVPRREVMSA
jgi:hypothetical protein